MKEDKGFTLAEVMITLTVIGIITAVIMPVAIHSKPDENVMKFKKAHNTLFQTISYLINSEKYYQDGNLGVKAGGSDVNSATYFCESFSDNLTLKSQNCSSQKTNSVYAIAVAADDIETVGKYADCLCASYIKAGAEIITADKVVYYNVNPYLHFGLREDGSKTDINSFNYFCMDVDGINNGIMPFGYAIRQDGKIIAGARANKWLEKNIQDNQEEEETQVFEACKIKDCKGAYGEDCKSCNQQECTEIVLPDKKLIRLSCSAQATGCSITSDTYPTAKGRCNSSCKNEGYSSGTYTDAHIAHKTYGWFVEYYCKCNK